MKNIAGFLIALLFVVNSAQAETMSKKQASKQIAQAVEAFEPLAQSGVEVYKVKIGKNVKETLINLGMQEKQLDSREDISWTESDDKWEADSTNFGPETMKGAYSYVMNVDPDYYKSLTPVQKSQFNKKLDAAKEAFKLLLNTGVQFGVVPMGAVQCGVTFAALAIIDVHSGTIYVVSMEGSGC